VIALVIVLGGCDVGEVPPAGGGPDAGNGVQAQKFATVVKPVVMRCAIAGCHSTVPPATGQPPNFYSYDTLAPIYRTPPSSGSLIITHVTDGGPHNNITYLSTAEKKTIADWIDGKN
jgi:uncharacterized membrane protein